MAPPSTVRQPARVPQPAARTGSLTSATPAMATGSNATALYLQRTAGNQQALATLATDKQATQGSATTASGPGTTAATRPPRLPPLAPEIRLQMTADIDEIVRILKKGTPDTGDQTRLLEAVRVNARRDDDLPASERAEHRTPMLDHFLVLLKSRSFSRSSFRSLWQAQYAIVYDTLWYELRGYWLQEFKRVVRQSQTQRTDGPQDKDSENGVALIARQEAMGLWGMLKGMGTGLVGMAGPKAAQAMAAQFDETAHILFGHEWDSSEPLVWGMNAGQIGTAGGDVIWQLVMFARSANAGNATKVMALVNRLRTLMAVGSGLQGVALAAFGIARVIEIRQAQDQPITITALLDDDDFLDQIVALGSSVISTTLAAKGTPTSPEQALARARAGILLSKLQIATSLKRLNDIAASKASDQDKERQYGQVLTGLIPQLVSFGVDAHAYVQAKRDVPAPTTPPPTTPPRKPPAAAAAVSDVEGTRAAAQKPVTPEPPAVRVLPPVAAEPADFDRTAELPPHWAMQPVSDAAPAASSTSTRGVVPTVPDDVPPAHVIDFLARQKQAAADERPRVQLEIPQPTPQRTAPTPAADDPAMSMAGRPRTGSPTKGGKSTASTTAAPPTPAAEPKLDLAVAREQAASEKAQALKRWAESEKLVVGAEDAAQWRDKRPSKNEMDWSDVAAEFAKGEPKAIPTDPARGLKPDASTPLVRVRIGRGGRPEDRYRFEPHGDSPGSKPLTKAGKAAQNKDYIVLPEAQAREMGFVAQGEEFHRLSAEGERLNASGQVLDDAGAVDKSTGQARTGVPFELQVGGKQVLSKAAREPEHPVAGRASVKPTKASEKKAIESGVTPSLQEPDSLKFVVANGELALTLAGNANAPGADHVTFDPKTGRVYLNDATTPKQSKKPKSTHAQWRKDFEDRFPVVKPGQRDFGFDPATNAAINQAITDNQVYARTLRPASEQKTLLGRPVTVDKLVPFNGDPQGLRVYTQDTPTQVRRPKK